MPARRPEEATDGAAPLSHPADHDFLRQTVEFWQPRADRPLTREDAREIFANVSGFFKVLDEWDRAEQKRNGHPAKRTRTQTDAAD